MILQIPPEVPHPHESSLFDPRSPFDVALYLVIPVLVVAYFFWRRP